MRGKKIVVLLLVLMVAVVLFFGGQTESDGNYALYFLAEPEHARGSDAVKAEYCDLTLPEDAVEAARMVLERYWAGPQSSGLKTPLPAGLQLQDVQFGGGRLQVDVSPQYRTLSGIDLTLADSCLTMTLAQLDGVYAVTVTVNGRPLEYRSEQELRLRDMLLSSQEELVGTVDATLWFADENGGFFLCETGNSELKTAGLSPSFAASLCMRARPAPKVWWMPSWAVLKKRGCTVWSLRSMSTIL